MRVAEYVILSALRQGGCIKSFYRISARQAVASPDRPADGYCLETPGASGDTPLSDTDFRSVEHFLECAESWEQTVGALCFGGATWLLRSDTPATEF